MLEFKSFASGSAGNLNTLSDGEGTYIMLDCGLPWRKVRKMLNFKTSEFSGICLTHHHKDHSAGIADAVRAGVDVYLLPETSEALGLEGHRVHEITLLDQFKIGTFQVKAFPLEHDAPNCGFLFVNGEGEKAVYITDTAYCRFVFPPLSIIAVGVNYSLDILRANVASGVVSSELKRRIIQAHMSLQTLKDFFVANDLSSVREIWLLHGSASNLDKKDAKQQVQAWTGKPVYV